MRVVAGLPPRWINIAKIGNSGVAAPGARGLSVSESSARGQLRLLSAKWVCVGCSGAGILGASCRARRSPVDPLGRVWVRVYCSVLSDLPYPWMFGAWPLHMFS